jgi:hypothetical protein
MKKKFCIPFACSVLTLFALCAPMSGQDQARTKPLKLQLRYAEPITHGSDRATRAQVIQSGRAASVLPVWNFQALSTRDGNIYAGSMVGANPAARGSDARVSVTGQVVPIILKLHTIGVSFNQKTGKIKTNKN